MALGRSERARQFPAAGGQPPGHVVHGDDGPVHEQAEVNGSKTHQVAREAQRLQTGYPGRERERDHGYHDQRPPPIAEQQEVNSHDEQRAFEQVVAHSAQDVVDQRRAVVERAQFDAGRQLAFKIYQGRGHPAGDGPAILARQGEGGAQHDFLAVERGRSRARTRPVRVDDRHVAQQHWRRAPTELDGQAAQFLGRLCPHQRTHGGQDRSAVGQPARARGGVARQRRRQVVQVEAVLDQFWHVWLDDVLAVEPARVVHVSHPRHGAHRRSDHEVLQSF